MLFLAAGTVTAALTTANAQVNVNCNIGRQPMWGPTGYDNADYYYMPDIDAYYNVNDAQFIYQDGGNWAYGASLPYAYRNYDLYGGYKVVINGSQPWLRHSYYRNNYYSYRGRRQNFIRDSRDYRYFENVNHPYHNQWRGGGYYSGRGGYRDNGYGRRGGGGGWNRGSAYNDGRGFREGRGSNEGNYRGGRYDNDGRGRGGWNGRR